MTTPNISPAERFQQAVSCRKNGDPDQAICILEKISESHPDFYQAKPLLMDLLLCNSKFHDSPSHRKLLQEVQTRTPLIPLVFRARILLALLSEESELLASLMAEALKACDNGYIYTDLCLKHLSPEEATVLFESVSGTNNPELLHRLAGLYINKGQPRKAIPLLEQAIKTRPPKIPVARLFLSALLTLDKHKELDQWLSSFSTEIQLDNEIRLTLARSLQKRQRLGEALAITRELIRIPEISSKSFSTHCWLLLTADRADEYASILRHPEIEKHPILASHFYFRTGKFRKSLEYAEKHWNQYPGDINAVILYSHRFQTLREFDKAANVLEQELKDHDKPVLYRELLTVYAKNGNNNACLKTLELFESRHSYTRNEILTLAQAYTYLLSDLERENTIRTYVEENPEDDEIFFCYCEVLRITGKESQADKMEFDRYNKRIRPSSNISEEIKQIDTNNSAYIYNACFPWLHADKETWNFDAWLKRANWGLNANTILMRNIHLDCKYYHPGSDWSDYPVEPVDWSLVDRLLEKKRGLVAVTSHHGPYTINMTQILIKYGDRVTLGSTVNNLKPRIQSHYLAKNPKKSLKIFKKSLTANGILFSAPDKSRTHNNTPFDFLAGKCEMSSMYCRLAYAHQSPSVLLTSIWTPANKLRIIITELPTPQANESENEFTQRWCQDYLRQVSQLLIGDPANISFDDDWQNWVSNEPHETPVNINKD